MPSMLTEFTSENSEKNYWNCVKKKMLVRDVLFDIRVNFCPSLQMMPALKNQCTVSIEYFYLPTLLKKTKMICSLAVNHRWKEKPSLQFVLKDIL